MPPPPVITVAAQGGAGGQAIARIVAQRLDYHYYDREVIADAAAMAEVSPETVAAAERWPSFIERMLERLARASAFSEGVVPATPAPGAAVLTMTSADYRQLIERVVRELANRGRCVIVNHAGQCILRDRPSSDVFKVLIHGSLERRAERYSREASLQPADALKEIEESDNTRINFFKHVYGVGWLDSSLYDLTINTDEVEDATAADLILGSFEG